MSNKEIEVKWGTLLFKEAWWEGKQDSVVFLGVYLYVRGVEKKKDMKKRSWEMTENEAIYVQAGMG